MKLTVIKLGGSLIGSPELPLWLESIESNARNSNIIIVPGGGVFADVIRENQSRLKFDDVVAHQMALLAMAQYGYYLAGLNPEIELIDNVESIQTEQLNKKPWLWLPVSLLDDFSEIPASWDYTSDSIALWFATKLNADDLILVKSKSLNNNKSLLINHINNGDIDKGFQRLIEYYSGEVCFFSKDQHQLLA